MKRFNGAHLDAHGVAKMNYALFESTARGRHRHTYQINYWLLEIVVVRLTKTIVSMFVVVVVASSFSDKIPLS